MIKVTQSEYDTHIATLVGATVETTSEHCGWEIESYLVSDVEEARKSTHITGVIKYRIKNT